MYARKRFGQHFLHDAEVISRIVDAIDPHPGEHLVEIGPGRGALTGQLLERAGSLTAIEIDRDLAAELGTRFDPRRLTLHTGDALDVDFTALRGAGPRLRIFGNLPYNISTPLLFHLLKHRKAIHDLLFMLQKEVVDRMAASPGSKIYGRLTVMLAPWVRIEPLFTVGPGAFKPAPKISSTVVRLEMLDPPSFETGGERFEKIVRAAFSQRRKTLRNALKPLLDVEAFSQQLAVLGVDPGARPEQLTPQQFAALARL